MFRVKILTFMHTQMILRRQRLRHICFICFPHVLFIFFILLRSQTPLAGGRAIYLSFICCHMLFICFCVHIYFNTFEVPDTSDQPSLARGSKIAICILYVYICSHFFFRFASYFQVAGKTPQNMNIISYMFHVCHICCS